MPNEHLSPDPDSLVKWQQLPQNRPKAALPPMTGGTRLVGWLLLALGMVVIFGLLQGRL